MVRCWWALIGLSLVGCEKSNKVDIQGTSQQGETCLTACQNASQKGTSAGTPWCGLPVPSATVKGADLTACQKDCTDQGTPPATIQCTAEADDCAEVQSCGFLAPKK